MNHKNIKGLLIEDNPGDARLIQEMLSEAKAIKFSIKSANTLSSGIQLLGNENFDMILLDLSLPDSQNLNTFSEVHTKAPRLPIIVLSGLDDENLAVKAVQDGAQDYLVKGKTDSNLLVRSIRYAIERKQTEELLKQHAMDLEKANYELKQALDDLLIRVEQKQKLPSAESIDIEDQNRGGVFLYPLEHEDMARTLFLLMFDAGLPCLAVIRSPPNKFRRVMERDIETVWLTTNRISESLCLNPSNITRLSMIINEFFKKAPQGVVFFESVEYLLSIVGFKDLLSLVQMLNDKIALIEGTVYLVLDLGVLEEKEIRYLKRECLQPPNDEKNQ